MSDSNRALSRRWFEEVWNQRKVDTIDELLHPEATGHMEGPVEVRGRDDFKKVRAQLLDAFPDIHLHVEDIVAEGDHTVVRWHAHGSHQGHALGIPASHRAADFRGLTWLKWRHGQIVEGWDAWDIGGLMQKLSLPAG
jgi:steroid delta-isomerase-like uncharacterized protein